MKRLDRRDALKVMGLGSAALLTGVQAKASTETRLSVPSSKKEARIVIAGGGTGGMLAAARLRRSAPNAEITLIAPNAIHLYQSGQVYVAAGLYSEYDNKRQTQELLPDKVNWLQDKVAAFIPDSNKVQTEKNGDIPYDYLIVALGCEYDYSSIEGLTSSDIGKNGITSVYLNDLNEGSSRGAVLSRMWLKSIRRHAEKSDVKILFADPSTPVKGEGASLDMLFLANDMLRGNGLDKKGEDLQQKVSLILTKAGKQLFPSPEIERALKKELKAAGNVTVHYDYVLKQIDREKKLAIYSHGADVVEIPYDYLHITPAMQSPKALLDSGLTVQRGEYKGWLEIDKKTLQNPRYPNVFGIGDVAGLPSGKSGGAIREQAIVLQDNIAAILEEKKLPMYYNGYSVSPIKTRYGRVMLAEYTPKGLLPTFPFDPTRPRWIWWEMDLHLMRRAYFDLMMRGMM